MGSARGSVTAWFLACLPLSLQDAGAVPELAPLGVVEFEPEAWSERRVGTVHIDRTRRIWVCDERSGRLHVYDEQGKPLFAVMPEPAGEFGRFTPAWFADGAGGQLFVGTNRHLVELDASGRQLGRRRLPAQGRRHLPTAGGRFEIGDERVWFRTEKQAAREVALCAEGATFHPAATEALGGLVVCEQDPGSDPGSHAPRVLRFGANGELVSRASLAQQCWILDLLVQGDRVLLLVDTAGRECALGQARAELWRLNSGGEIVQRSRLPEELERPRQVLAAATVGEVLVLGAREPRLHRFALP